MFRCSAAAAAGHPESGADQLRHGGGKVLGAHPEVGAAVHALGESGVGLDEHGKGGEGEQLREESGHLFRAQAAVEPDDVHSQTLHQGHSGGQISAGEHAARLVQDHRDKNGQVTVFLGGQDGGLGLMEVAHGLNEHQVGAGGGAGPDGGGVGRHGLLKGQIPHGPQQPAGGAHIQGHKAAAVCGYRLAGQAHGGGDNGLHRMAGELDGVSPKGIGGDNIGAGGQVLGMDSLYSVGALQVPALRLVACRQPGSLKHGAHAAVKNEHPAGEFFSDVHGWTPLICLVVERREVPIPCGKRSLPLGRRRSRWGDTRGWRRAPPRR